MCSYKYTVLVNNQSCPNLPGGTRHPFQVDAPYLLSIGILEPRRNQDKLICCCLIPQFKRVVIPCPVPWLTVTSGIRRVSVTWDLLSLRGGLGKWEEMELAGMGQGSTVLSPIFESLEACLSACWGAILLHQPHLSCTGFQMRFWTTNIQSCIL